MRTSIRSDTAAALMAALLVGGCGSTGNSAAPTGNAAAMAGAASSSAVAGPTDAATLPAPTHSVSGRTVTVSLPYRTADGLLWVSATRMSDAAPFVFKGLEAKPGAGPDNTDLAVFTYEADRSGTATLKFGLVPAGKMLIGLPSMVYTGPVAARYEATVSAP